MTWPRQYAYGEGSLWRQLGSVRVVLTSILLPVLALLTAAALQNRSPIHRLMGDPVNYTDVPLSTGAFSYIGILLWCATISVCVLTYVILANGSSLTRTRWFLLAAGAFTCVLMLDDLFLLHKEFFPRYLSIAQELIYVGYALLAALFLFHFKKEILETEFVLLILSFAFFASSILIDLGLLAWLARNRHIRRRSSERAGAGRWCFRRLQMLRVRGGPTRIGDKFPNRA